MNEQLEFDMDDQAVPFDQQEDFEDVDSDDPDENWAEHAALWSTDWTAETIVRQLQKENIQLNPNWQRRAAWKDDRQSKFIESLIMGLPVPQIILAEDKSQKGKFIVIDGKQRLITLRRFAGIEADRLILKGLKDREDLNGKSYEDFEQRAELQGDLANFDNQSIRTIIIKNWGTEKYLYSVFLRINTGSVQLSPQELRQALSPGKFSNFIDEFSSNSDALKKLLGLKEPDFRMRDAELLLRYISYKSGTEIYTGSLKTFLDHYTKYYNEYWTEKQDWLLKQASEFEAAIDFSFETFGRNAMRKWNGKKFERVINRAVFDIIAFFYSQERIRELCKTKHEDIRQRFVEMCENDNDFLSALERTTKSKEANQIRFDKWAAALSEITGSKISSPRFSKDA